MIIHGDCLYKMREMEDNSIDFIVTDCPYGLSFMGKKWDETTPDIKIWKEALRVCKPGSMLAAFGGTRTHHHLMTTLEWAGWEIRDVIMYLYGSGFPKSHNFGKKLGGIWEGFGTALKPAYEPIIIAMKPLHGTYIQNAEKWGVAGINIDESRIIPSIEDAKSMERCNTPGSGRFKSGKFGSSGPDGFGDKSEPYNTLKGRWPSNLILDEESAQQLDEMTGILKSGDIKPYISKSDGFLQGCKGKRTNEFKGDSEGASRFFYCAKASSSERNRGLEGMPLKEKPLMGEFKENPGRKTPKSSPTARQNFHPTVKPLSLMKYILKLLAPPGDPICLDPFAGSGTTLLAAKELGIRAIGIELEKEYCEIAEKRLSAL